MTIRDLIINYVAYNNRSALLIHSRDTRKKNQLHVDNMREGTERDWDWLEFFVTKLRIQNKQKIRANWKIEVDDRIHQLSNNFEIPNEL